MTEDKAIYANFSDKDIISIFKNDFLAITNKGYIRSEGTKDRGVGKTFEHHLGIKENNYESADFLGRFEIKSYREYSRSNLSLYTKVPDNPPKVGRHIREDFGYFDKKHDKKKVLRISISTLDFKPPERDFSFKLEIDEKQEKIFLKIKEKATGKLVNEDIHYTFNTLREKIETKCHFIIYVKGKVKKENGIEAFWYTDAILLSGLTFEKFLLNLKNGIFEYDLRYGLYSDGSYHDHGPCFRISKKRIDDVFTRTKILT
jgi:hypothetical protein